MCGAARVGGAAVRPRWLSSQGPPPPDQLAAIGALLGASTADVKQEMVSCFEALAQSVTDAVRAATDVGPAR